MSKNNITDELYSSDEEQTKPVSEIAKKRNKKRNKDWEAPGGLDSDKIEYQQFLTESLGKVDNYQPSYILNEISNRLLYSKEVTEIYNTVKDPLELEKQSLKDLTDLYTSAAAGAKEGELNRQDYEEIAKQTQEALKKVTELQTARDNLAMELKGTFSFIPRMPSESFVQKCKEKPEPLGNDKVTIVKRLAEYRYKLATEEENFKTGDEFKQLCDFFNIQATTKNGDRIREAAYTDLTEKIEEIIGRYPTRSEINEYSRIANLEEMELNDVAKLVHQKVQDNLTGLYKYIDLKDTLSYAGADGLTRTYQDILRDQQVRIAKLDKPKPRDITRPPKVNFLAQVRASRKYNRVAYKEAIIENNYKQRANLPPGANTSNTFFPTGSMTHFVGTLESYREITTEQNSELSTYRAIVTKNKAHSKTIESLKNLSQVEAIRNPSALLTNAMFFDLVEQGSLNIEELPNKMPMAMEGAVPSAIKLEQTLKEHQSSRMVYDYRDIAANAAPATLAIKNDNILFQWLAATKLEKDGIPITNINSAIKGAHATIQNVNQASPGCTVKYYDSADQVIQYLPEDQYNNTPIADISKITIENNNGYCVELNPQTIIKIGQWDAEKAFEQRQGVGISYFKKCIASQGNARQSNTTKGMLQHFEEVIKEKKNDSTVRYFDSKGNLIEDIENTRINDVHKIEIEKNGESIELETEKVIAKDSTVELYQSYGDLIACSITTFPAKVFNELSQEWYGVTLAYLEDITLADLKLKAAAEPHEPETDRQPDPERAVINELEKRMQIDGGEDRSKWLQPEEMELKEEVPRKTEDDIRREISKTKEEPSLYSTQPTTPLPSQEARFPSFSSLSEQQESRVNRELFPVISPTTPNQPKSTNSLLQAGMGLLTPEKTPEQNKKTTTIQASHTLSDSTLQTPTSIFSLSETSGIKVDSALSTEEHMEEAKAIGQKLKEKQKRPRPEAPPGQELTNPANKKYSNRSRSPSPGFDN